MIGGDHSTWGEPLRLGRRPTASSMLVTVAGLVPMAAISGAILLVLVRIG